MSTNKRRLGGQNALTEPVAGNGLLHRRALLGGGMAIAGAMGAGPSITGAAAEPLAVDPWTLEPGSNSKAYELPSRFEKNTVRTLSNPNGEPRTQHARTPHHLLNGTITPNGLHFTIVHGGTPDIDPDKHRLAIHGLVKQPKVFTLETLARYPMVSRMTFVECGGNSAPMFSREPLQGTAQATARAGVVRRMDRRAAVDAARRSRHRPRGEMADRRGRGLARCWRAACRSRRRSTTRWSRSTRTASASCPATAIRCGLLLPGYEGNMNVKWLRRIKLVDQPAMTYYETRTYSPILPNGKAYRFYFLQEVKSFITHPSVGNGLKGPGYYEISGIAYSGTGRIAKVMVTADGGKSWAQAALQEPVQSKAFTRFRVPWRWDGGPAVLQSRAWDEAGNVQPTRAEIVGRARRDQGHSQHRRLSRASTTTGRRAGRSKPPDR